PHGIPSHDTFSRVFSMIDSYHFEEIFIEWIKEVTVSKLKPQSVATGMLKIDCNEDRSRARVKNEAQSIALIRRISIAYLKKDLTIKSGIKCKRKKANWDESYLFKILSLGLDDKVDGPACTK
ncbi:MAG TPA: transposase family protein, partial [Candidatus Berkiella sp.]|nr:transposase family protein [Candidatus Berkiella sp.]